ncbi:MAG: cation transporter [Ruminococcus sp.]|nr:cation transporter [Ruminococcus sp.]
MDRTQQIVKVSYRGIAANILLVVFKSIVGFAANSISVILDAVNNLSDVLSSVITIIGTKLAGRAPDKKHPYGHGRIEYITSLIIAVIVLAAGVTSLKEAVEKIVTPADTNFTIVSIIIIVGGIVTKFFLGRYFIAQGKKLNSSSLTASGTDASFDAVISFATLVSAVISMTLGWNIEGWLGAVISVFIIKAGIEIMRDTISDIIGVRIDRDLSIGIRRKVNSFPEVFGSYDLILHNYGPEENLGSIHIEVKDNMTAKQIDVLTRKITAAIYADFGVYLTIGIYATNTDSAEASEIKKTLVDLVKQNKTIIGLHGFYYNDADRMVSFDLIFDFDEKHPFDIVEKIKAALSEKYSSINFVINIDRDYSD